MNEKQNLLNTGSDVYTDKVVGLIKNLKVLLIVWLCSIVIGLGLFISNVCKDSTIKQLQGKIKQDSITVQAYKNLIPNNNNGGNN